MNAIICDQKIYIANHNTIYVYNILDDEVTFHYTINGRVDMGSI